jgi:hypothetical protein
MVFFMIMPLIFGAFGNFLLPTQLGVHDVAFPRLNSAAFWFLPAGLFMLCQLVCVERRFQRINCFNVRELESLLKNKFFADFNTYLSFNKSIYTNISNLRYKLNDINFTSSRASLSFYYSILETSFLIKPIFSWTLSTSNSTMSPLSVKLIKAGLRQLENLSFCVMYIGLWFSFFGVLWISFLRFIYEVATIFMELLAAWSVPVWSVINYFFNLFTYVINFCLNTIEYYLNCAKWFFFFIL